MKDRLRFVTLFPMCSNVEVVKDVGQIPYTLARSCNIDAHLVSSVIDIDGPNIDEIAGLHIERYPLVFNNAELTGALYILKNAKKIDWLNLYHAGRHSLYWLKIYKFLNPRGKVYLKLDLDFRSCDKYDNDLRERTLFVNNIEKADLVTVETEAVLNRIQPYAGKKIRLLSNGYYKLNKDDIAKRNRENVFLTVGRLGTEQKATEILLNAFAQSAGQHNWKLKLVGSVEPAFERIRESFYQNHPELADKVIFMGVINDREKIYNEYYKAKVFVLPSRWESFGLVLPEALSCGCRIIVSDQVPTMNEMTRNGRYGRIVPVDNVDALSEALLAETKEIYTEEMTSEIEEYARENYSWEKICKVLLKYMQEIERANESDIKNE